MSITVSVVTTPEALAQAFSIRSQVYIGEQKCPYNEEFDGNDYCALHILTFADGEPAGTIRIRWFHDYAKFERVAVLTRYRSSEVALEMMKYATEIVRRKGFRKICGFAQKRLLNYWSKQGYLPFRPEKVFVFSDHEYVEVVQEFPPHPDAINLHSDPYLAMRVEGRWDEAGILDESAHREATNPH